MLQTAAFALDLIVYLDLTPSGHDTLGRMIARLHDPRWGRWRRCLENGHQDSAARAPPDDDPTPQLAARYRRSPPD